LSEIARRIDWTFFFHAWKLNGAYPAILSHPEKGREAKKLLADGEKMLEEIVSRKMLTANGVVGIYPANSAGDDVAIYENETREKRLATFHFLRDQRKKPEGEFNLSLADFVAPRETGRPDYLGGFIATAGLGIERWVKEFENENDDYNVIMIKILADRLAEAFAELLHEKVRKELWGFSSGIRPAIGYPSVPDHAEKRILFDLLDPERKNGVMLTETYGMRPAASVCGLYFANEMSRYFDPGRMPVGITS
jgi:5-methyltetrahydrofolate--homocysteine methyltransferase